MFERWIAATGFLLLIAVFLLPGCSGKELEDSRVSRSIKPLELAYSRQQYNDQKLSFSTTGNLLAVTGYKDVTVVDLTDNSVLQILKSPDSKITNSQFLDDGKKYLLATDETLQIWSATDWKMNKQIKAAQISKLSGVSPDSVYLYFDAAIWRMDDYQKIIEIGEEPSPNDLDFSAGNNYLAVAGHYSGVLAVDRQARMRVKGNNPLKGVNKVRFLDEASYYASYGAVLDIENGGYLASRLGLFQITSGELIKSYSPPSRITCWTSDPKHGVLVALHNGDVVLLDHQLGEVRHWHLPAPANVCEQDKNMDVWFGTAKSGVYKLDLKRMTLSHEYRIENPIFDLQVSPDGKYLGVVEMMPGETIAKVFNLD